MPKYSQKSLLLKSLSLSFIDTAVPRMAHSQPKLTKKEETSPKTFAGVALPDPNEIHKKIQQNHPAELFDNPNYPHKGAELKAYVST